MAEQGFMFLLMSLSDLTINQLKEVQTLCADKIKEREARNGNNN